MEVTTRQLAVPRIFLRCYTAWSLLSFSLILYIDFSALKSTYEKKNLCTHYMKFSLLIPFDPPLRSP
jgi:hypothetical protein